MKNVQLKVKVVYIHLSAKVKVKIYLKASVKEKWGGEEKRKCPIESESDIYSLVGESDINSLVSEIENLPQAECEGNMGQKRK